MLMLQYCYISHMQRISSESAIKAKIWPNFMSSFIRTQIKLSVINRLLFTFKTFFSVTPKKVSFLDFFCVHSFYRKFDAIKQLKRRRQSAQVGNFLPFSAMDQRSASKWEMLLSNFEYRAVKIYITKSQWIKSRCFMQLVARQSYRQC